MKRMKLCLKVTSLCLIFAMAVGFSSCARIEAKDLMEGIEPRDVEPIDGLQERSGDVTDFAVRLLQTSAEEKKNTLISPVSLLYALAMTLNGAEGETREQIEAAVGMSAEELNLYLYSYMNSLPQGDKYKLSLANSIWFNEAERFDVNEDFLQINADYYGADIYEAAFDDSTVKDINRWINNRTDGMIEDMLDEIPTGAVVYLINALSFDAKWETEYERDQIKNGVFTNADGEAQSVDFMYSTEGRYLEDENATGFVKYYKDKKYAFVALLPNEGMTVEEYVATLDGDSLNEMLASPGYDQVYASIPQFETSYNAEMSYVLKKMGITKLFDSYSSELSGIGTSEGGELYISRVLHETYISVDDKGTKAAAVTIFETNDGGAMTEKTVCLDRPFVYMLIDCNTKIPFFMGIMNDIKK